MNRRLLIALVALTASCSLVYEPGQPAGACADCDDAGGSDETCTDDPSCDDGLFCTGVERCGPGEPGADDRGCVRGIDPADDGLDCTEDQCDEATGQISHTSTDACQCAGDDDCLAATSVDPACGTVFCGHLHLCEVDYRPAGASCPGLECQVLAQCDGQGRCLGGTNDAVCDDLRACNGVEYCRPERPDADERGCVRSTAPEVADGVDCTVDVCVECAPADEACWELGHTSRHDFGGSCLQEGAICVEATVPPCMEVICASGQWTLQPQPAGAGCDDGIACTRSDACDGQGHCTGQPHHSACSDGVFCNGAEKCDPSSGCAPGDRPDQADPDGRNCTVARCVERDDIVYWSPAACANRTTGGLVAFYPFIERANSQFAYNLAPGGDISLDLRRTGNGVTWLANRHGVSFNGGSGQILATSNAATHLLQRIRATNAFTLELWLKPKNLEHRGPDRILTFSKDTNHGNFTVGQEREELRFRLRGEGANDAGDPAFEYADALTTEESHFVITFDAGAVVAYKNGALLGTSTGNITRPGALAAFDDAYKLALGNELTLDRQWEGELYLVAIYDRALTAAEVQRHFAAGSQP